MARQCDDGGGSSDLTRANKARTAGRLARFAMAIVFALSVAMLIHEFRRVSGRDIMLDLAGMPPRQVLAAVALTALSYLLLSGYDFLALRYARRHLGMPAILFASFTAFAVSNSIGIQLLSGGSVRYHVYKKYGLTNIEIGAVVIFCSFSYVVGIVTVGGAMALVEPRDMGRLLGIPQAYVIAAGVLLLLVTLAYLGLCALWRKPISISGYHLHPPSLPLVAAQVALASIDPIVAGTVIYALLPHDPGLSYQAFLPAYLIAATASVLTLVPGGLGVFEAAMTLLMAPPSKAAALSAFLAYRAIYFIAPLLIAIIVLVANGTRGGNAGDA